jgi:hypothetical protein|tara:strand:- start:3644 stop:4462 length:819 start_codon:yes stop_codon:yes gene_type:complete
MGLSKLEAPEVLNFVITGQLECGASLLREALNRHSMLICHGDLLAEDDASRRVHHESYFGPSGNTPDWLVAGHISGEQYLTNKIFDNPLRGEKAIGVKIPYSRVYAYDLWDYLSNRCLVGDFCMIQVKRNPVACFVSIQQRCPVFPNLATPQESSFERELREISDLPPPPPPPLLQLDIDELVSFVRQHAAADEKIARVCDDRLEINYSELIYDFPNVFQETLKFLGMPSERVKSPICIKGAGAGHRLTQWRHLRDKVPHDIRSYFEDKEFF